MEKYSVLMSVYAKEKPEYLKESIDSMLGQTIHPDQFVLVKDGMLTNQLDTIIDEFVKANNELFTIIELPHNSGLGVALDEGIKYCRNDLVARMDSDDISLPDRCQKELKLFDNRPELSIVSGYVGEFEDNPENVVSIRTVPECQEEIKKRMRIRSAFNHPAVMYRKSSVIRSGGYGTLRRKQDHVLFSHMINSGCEAYNIQEVILLFRANKESLERKKSRDNSRCYIEAQKINYKRGECSFLDLFFVCALQTVEFMLPKKVAKYVRQVFFRKGKPNYIL